MFRRDISKILSRRFVEPRRMIQVVAGPRQVGKTFAVKQALDEYSGSSTYRLSEGLGLNPLQWLESVWNEARVVARQGGCHLLVIDEIQKVAGWSEVVKRLWDEDGFAGVNLKVVLLGSSRLLLQKGLNESLAGRYELLEAGHWTYSEMHEAFGFTADDYVLYGGYPGSVSFREDGERWRAYIRDAIAEPSISTDILQMETIAKPALLRQTFILSCLYSARILSYQKMLGQLQDAGNATTLAHYLKLLAQAGLVAGLEKFHEESVRVKTSSPKLAVCNNALLTALAPHTLTELRSRPDLWGHVVESAVGAHLMASARKAGIDCLYWNMGSKEVDYVLRRGDRLAAIEVKTGAVGDVSGMREFCRKYSRAKSYVVGGVGMSVEQLFGFEAEDLLVL